MNLGIAICGVVSLGAVLLRYFYDRQEDAAHEFHANLRGDSVDWRALKGKSGTFLATVVRLECARIEDAERRAKAALIHNYHPLTPAMWFCGETSEGRGTMDKPTCPRCLLWYIDPLEKERWKRLGLGMADLLPEPPSRDCD